MGPLLLWSVRCIGEKRKQLQHGTGLENGDVSGVYESTTRNEIREELKVKAKDVMVFAGLVKLRLGQGILERIMSGCSEVGVY